MAKVKEEALTYDDVLLVPQFSKIRPRETVLHTQLTKSIGLKIPVISAPMDTVTESPLAIALALEGGIGIIHKNLAPEVQAEHVLRVKRFENGFIEDPVTVSPEQTIADVAKIKRDYGYEKIPVVDHKGTLVGLITELDYFLPDDLKLPVKLKMKRRSEIIVAKQGVTLGEANRTIRKAKLWALPVVTRTGKLVSMVTRKDLEKNEDFPNSAKDEKKRLRVGASVGVGPAELERAALLVAAGVDVLVVDTAHGHSEGVLTMVRSIKRDKAYLNTDVIGGNVATAEGALALARAGADAVKVGVGPGSICTTRVVAGVGVPQLTAVQNVVAALSKRGIPCIADGGIRYSGDIVKALAVGASTVMLGGLLAGTRETPGTVVTVDGHLVKSYRGMGSAKAMSAGSKDRYGQNEVTDAEKFVPEGVEGTIPYRGPLQPHLLQLIGGVRSGMGYIGAKTLAALRKNASFVRVTPAGRGESHPHSLLSIHPAKNYQAEN